MAKPKQRGGHTAHGNKKKEDASDIDQLDEGDWMMVKKQRVTILIPPLPIKSQSTMTSNGAAQPQGNPMKANTQLPDQDATSLQCLPSKWSVLENEKSVSSCHQEAVPPAIAVCPSELTSSSSRKISSVSRGISSDSSLQSRGDVKCLGIRNASRMRKRTMVFADRSASLNQRMRASYLEKKLEKVGGLENWLASLGLSSFLNVFEGKFANKIQLANLTMGKLKDMGAYAVGPRRKLMHAIACICEPHCFQHLRM